MDTNTEQIQNKMNPDLEKLIRLQVIDKEIARKSELLNTILPAEIEALRSGVETARDKLNRFDKDVESLGKKRRELESDVESHKGAIAKAKLKLPDVKTNVEYRAILKELDTFEKKIVEVDDKQIELMEALDGKDDEKKALGETLKKEEAAFGELKVEKEEAMTSLKKALAELTAKRDNTISSISGAVLKNYEKISRTRGGIGVTKVLDQSCQSCFQMIQPQLYYLVRTSDKIIQCPHCDRYLYHEPGENEEE